MSGVTGWRRVDWNDPTTYPPDGMCVRVFRSVRDSHWAAWEGLVRSYFSGEERKVSVINVGVVEFGEWNDGLPSHPDKRPLDLPHHVNARNGEPLDTIWWRPA